MAEGRRSQKIRFIIIGIMIFVISIVLFVYLLVTGIIAMNEGLTRIVAPGTYELTLDKKGGYTVFWEFRSNIDGTPVYQEHFPEGFTLDISAPDGAYVHMKEASTDSTYSFGSREGVSILEFTVHAPGVYIFKADIPEGVEPRAVTLTFAQGFFGGILKTVFSSIAVLFGGIVVGALVIIIGLVTGRKNSA